MTSNSSFLPIYDEHLAFRLGDHRSGGFRAIIAAAEQAALHKGKPLLVVETGGLRKIDNWLGDGQSTRIFDLFVSHHQGFLYSVDIDPICAVLTRQMCSDRCMAVTADSVSFLRSLPGKQAISVLYLDSFDLDVNNPEPSSRHHVEELREVFELLEPGTVIAVDDNPVINGQAVGKGLLVQKMLQKRGVPMLYDGYQKVWQIKEPISAGSIEVPTLTSFRSFY